MPEKMDILEAQEVAEETFSELDTFTFTHPKRIWSIAEDVEYLQDTVTQELYFDEDNRTVAYEAVRAIELVVKKLEAIKSEILAKA